MHNKGSLQAAGSKYSHEALIDKQCELPIHFGKFYKVEDVDALFTLFNGVFTNVTEEAFSKDETIENLQKDVATKTVALEETNVEITKLKDELSNVNSIVNTSNDVERLESDNVSLVNQLVDEQRERLSLAEKLSEMSAKFEQLAKSAEIKLKSVEAELSTVVFELDREKARNEQLVHENEILSSRKPEKEVVIKEVVRTSNVDTELLELREAYDLLNYRFNSLQKQSKVQLSVLENKLSKKIMK